MRKKIRILKFVPLVFAILYTLFISLFALDSFNDPKWYVALFMHLLPTFALILTTYFSWRNNKVGGFVFVALGLFFTWFFKSFLIFIPLYIIGLLFVLIDYLSSKTKKR